VPNGATMMCYDTCVININDAEYLRVQCYWTSGVLYTAAVHGRLQTLVVQMLSTLYNSLLPGNPFAAIAVRR